MIKPIHPFPARMAPELALAAMPEESGPIRVLDPMVGSGTTLVVARMRGHEAIGFDRDPLAVLIARTWAADIDRSQVEKKANEVLERAKSRLRVFNSKTAYPENADEETKEFLKFWFDAENRKELSALAVSIAGIRDEELRNVLWCAFSRLIITKKAGVSLAMDVSHSRPHRFFDKAPRRAFEYFIHSVKRVTEAAPFNEKTQKPRVTVNDADARNMPLSDGSIDLIITSPPYLNAIDYIRGHRLSLVWMGHSMASLRMLRATNVGTETAGKFAESDKSAEAVMERMCSGEPLDVRHQGMLMRYVRDLRTLLKECYRVLTNDGRGVFVVGDCNLRKTFVANSIAIEILSCEVGFRLAELRRRPLPENRRYLPPPDAKSAGDLLQKRMREEVILTLEKSPLKKGGNIMADDLTKRGQPDRDRVNVHEDWEVRDWAKKLGVTPQQLKDAEKKVGPMVKDIKRELGK